MKRKVVLVLVLAVLLAFVTASVMQAKPADHHAYSVYLVEACANKGAFMTTIAYCPSACNVGGAGYGIHLGHGWSRSECMNSATRVANLTAPRWEEWEWNQHAEVGETACIFWCCQPIPAMMVFSWEFQTVTNPYYLPTVYKTVYVQHSER